MDSNRNNMIVEDWQSLVNKPLYSSNGKDIGIVRSVQPQFLITSFGSIPKIDTLYQRLLFNPLKTVLFI